MENYNILVATTKDQKKYSFSTSATTLAELKRDFAAQGIDYAGMSFTEGITRLGILDDNSLLPSGDHTINYRGQNYSKVILLTNTQKNIASGAISRKEVYETIKRSGLQDAVKKEFGRNFTQVPTNDLEWFIAKSITQEVEVPECICETPKKEDDEVYATHKELVEFIYMGIRTLAKSNMLVMNDLKALLSLVKELADRTAEVTPEYSDDDIESILNSI